LETRRLKLFVVAYLRGLLKPDYKNGISSRIRENFILEALRDELDADAINNTLSADISAINVARQEDLSGLYDNIYAKIYKIRALREFEKQSEEIKELKQKKRKKQERRIRHRSVEDFAKLYKILDESGVLEQIANGKKT
tara:strand:- start:10351 stop:10770 length:420 start_codon:yes stop_codon:yes gene_type:complete